MRADSHAADQSSLSSGKRHSYNAPQSGCSHSASYPPPPSGNPTAAGISSPRASPSRTCCIGSSCRSTSSTATALSPASMSTRRGRHSSLIKLTSFGICGISSVRKIISSRRHVGGAKRFVGLSMSGSRLGMLGCR